MDIEKINGLFTLFSGETDVKKYISVINSAVCDVLPKLKKNADLSDERIAFLCAAVANLRYLQIKSFRDTLTFTRSGTAVTEDNSGYKSELARNLVRDYWISISDLVEDSDFVFIKI